MTASANVALRDRLRIAIQKSGRLSDPARALLAACGLSWRESRDRLFCYGETLPIDLLLVRDDDIPGLIADGVCDLGVVGRDSCFPAAPGDFLAELGALIAARDRDRPAGSYTTRLFDDGVRAIAQKVGEEGVETALAAVVQDDAALCGEAADLLFHLQVLLRARGLSLDHAVEVLRQRHRGA